MDLTRILQEWGTSALVLTGLGLLLKKVLVPLWKKKAVPWLVAWAGTKLARGVAGASVADADVRRWVQRVALATVELAEAKFPDAGLGPKRYEYAYTILTAHFPWLGAFLGEHGATLQEAIEYAVVEMDHRLKDIVKAAPTEAMPATAPPASATTESGCGCPPAVGE